MTRFEKDLRNLDRQLLLHFHPIKNRYVIYRRPEKLGVLPKYEFGLEDIKNQLSYGTLIEIMVLAGPDGSFRYPGQWVIDELQRRDSRVRNIFQQIEQMDADNESLKAKIREEASDVLRYRVGEDWRHIRDELRGDTSFRKYSVSKTQ